MSGHLCGSEHCLFSARTYEAGIGMFVDERGSTTVAAAVAILVSLVLVFGLANVQWATSAAADVQSVADAGALAGASVIASYATVAQVLDALVLSLGLIGMLTFAIGLVLSAIPLVGTAGPPVLEAAQSVFRARAALSKSASRGLQRLEEVVPYLVAANSFLTVRANRTSNASYVGVAVPYPLEGSSDFGILEADDADEKVEELRGQGEKIDELSEVAGTHQALADEALERGWLADCGDNPCMRERAGTLAGLSGTLNPSYPTSVGWNFGVPILRARAYYQQRLDQEVPLDASIAERVRSEARKAFYGYALQEVNGSSYIEYGDGTVACDLHGLPANTQDVRSTAMYTDAIWPTSQQADGLVVHAYAECPGADGPIVAYSSVAAIEAGERAECSVCQFTVVDLGRVGAASTAIDNGFEYHWARVVEASCDYEFQRMRQIEAEGEARAASEVATNMFEEALKGLSTTRVQLSPPGRFGCVCVVFDPSDSKAPDNLVSLFTPGAVLPPRAAIAGAVAARDGSESGNNILAGFFDGLVAQGGFVGGTSAVLDSVMTVWGDALVAYGNGYEAFTNTADSAFRGLTELGLGGVSTWLQDALRGVMSLAAIEPGDLAPKKAVLANTADIMNKAGNDWYAAVRSMVVAVQAVDADSGLPGVLGTIGVFLQTLTGEEKLKVAEIGIPGTEFSIPIEIDLEWLAGLGEAA